MASLGTWLVIFDGINLSGMAEGDCVKLGAPESSPTKTTIGADGDIIKTNDVQAIVRKFTLRVIKGTQAFTELFTRASLQLSLTTSRNPMPIYTGVLSYTTVTDSVIQTTAYPFIEATFSTYPEDIIRNANADSNQMILEFELEAVFPENLLV